MMLIIRILLIFACIWLLFVLAWRQLKLLLFGSANKNAGQPAKKTSSKSRRQHSVIPDEVGNYVDYTEVK